ncbi:MAG TPA: trypsin-like serine protease [Acidimicrobiales bacterium]|nr:trypsin-like serine protease [Acidimicrobiales bacterium]
MSRFTKRAGVVVALAALGASLTAVTGTPAATGQEAGDGAPVPIEVLSAPPAVGGESGGALTSPGSPGTGVLAESGLAPEATVARGTHEGTPVGGESVIGADGRVQVTDTTEYPASAIGQIEFTQNGSPFICTGWLIDPEFILTSGHCAYDPTAGGGDPIESAQFFPGRNGAYDPFGGCNVNGLFAKSGWRTKGKARHDWAIMRLDCPIGNTVGFLGFFAVPGVNQLDGKTGRVEGYPGDKPFGTHWKMSGTMATRTDASMIYYPIDTAGGQSGSPIMVANRPSCGGPCGMGIHSYGASGNPPLNSGPRITTKNFQTILGVMASN